MAKNGPSSQPGDKPGAGKHSGGKPRRRWLRILIWLVVLIPLVLAGTLVILSQTPAMKTVVEPILEAQLGVDVETGSVKLNASGRLVIEDLVLSSDSIDGRAGNLAEIERATINLNWSGMVTGAAPVSSIDIHKPRVRLSQDTDTGKLNLAQFDFAQDGDGGATPAIRIEQGVLEIGEHRAGSYDMLAELSIEGRIEEQDSDGVSDFRFVARPTESGMSESAVRSPGSYAISGVISDGAIQGRVDGVRLQDWPAGYVPSRARDAFERLDLAGELAPTRFRMDEDGQVEVLLTLDGVSLNLPFDETGTETGQGGLLRMRRTRGTILFSDEGVDADLTGLIDELEYNVQLKTEGLDIESPFEAVLVTDFRLDSRFRPAKFLPQNVISKLDRFENPVADIHARVLVERGGDGDIAVSGVAEISNGSATYKKFRYPFEQLEGTIGFDPDRLVIERITGVAPTGATLVAEGVFSPLGEESVVTLDIDVDGVPIDDRLMGALDEGQRDLVDALFSREEYELLVDEGLVLTSGEAQELRELRDRTRRQLDEWDARDGDEAVRARLAAGLNDLDRRLETPVFEFGGEADVDVVLRRHPERPEDDRWTTDVEVVLPEAGLVPGYFPLPIRAHDVELSITDQRVELTGGRYTGLTGGVATVEAVIDRTGEDAQPRVTVTARQIPIDARLVAAIPGYHDEQSDDPDDISLRRILDRLRMDGMVEARADIGPRSDGRLGYDVEATIIDGSARPAYFSDDPTQNAAEALAAGSDPLVLNRLYGTIFVTEELIVVDLSGMLASPRQPLAPTPIEVLTQLTLPNKERDMGGVRRENGLLPTDFGPPVPGPELYARARADGIDLAMPLQHAVAVVSPRIARDIMEYQDAYNPDGKLGVTAELEGFVGGAIDSSFGVDRIEDLAFDFEGTRYRVESSIGRGSFTLSHRAMLSFDGLRVVLDAEGDGENAGEVGGEVGSTLSLDGSLPLARGGRRIEITEPSELRIDYENGSLASPLSRMVMDRFGDEDIPSWFAEHEVTGRFDLDIALTSEMGVHRPGTEDEALAMVPVRINGELQPRSLGLTLDGRRVEFDEVSGRVVFDGMEGSFEEIRLVEERARIGVDGDWSMGEEEGLGVDLVIDARGELLASTARGVLPERVSGVIDTLEIQTQNELAIEGMTIEAGAIGREDRWFRIDGELDIEGGTATIGLPISELSGEVGFVVEGSGEEVGFGLELDASRLRAGRMRIFDAEVRVIGDAANPGVVLIPEIIAGMHGGRIAGSAQIMPGEGDTPEYWLDVHISGVRAAPVFDDLLLPPDGLEGPPVPGESTVLSAWSKGEDLSRGAMIGNLTLTGPVGKPHERVGRGLVQIAGSTVLELPGLINLIEASNLSMPTGAKIDIAEAAFYIEGETVVLERLIASSRKIEIIGYGTMDWETREVDMRFSTQSVNPIPIISELLEELRDELITTRVTGTLGDMNYSITQFASAKRLINALLGVPPTEQEQRMMEVEEQIVMTKRRSIRDDRTMVHQPDGVGIGSWDWGKPRSGKREDESIEPKAISEPEGPEGTDEVEAVEEPDSGDDPAR